MTRQHRAVGLEQDHHLERRLEHRAELRRRRRQRRGLLVDLAAKLELGLLGQGDVAADADEPDQLPVRAEPRLRDGAQPAIFAVMAQVAALEREALQRGFAGDALGDDPVDVVGMDLGRQSSVRASSKSQPGPQANSA